MLTRLPLATFHTLTSVSYPPLMMCWPSEVAARALTELVCPSKVWTSVPSTWYRLASCQPPTTKCTPSGSAATESTTLPFLKVRSSAPSSVQSFTVQSVETLTKRAPPGSTATAITWASWPSMVHTHASSRHTLTMPLSAPVMTRPPGAAATQFSSALCPTLHSGVTRVTTLPVKGRNFCTSFAEAWKVRHVNAVAAMSWASGNW